MLTDKFDLLVNFCVCMLLENGTRGKVRYKCIVFFFGMTVWTATCAGEYKNEQFNESVIFYKEKRGKLMREIANNFILVLFK